MGQYIFFFLLLLSFFHKSLTCIHFVKAMSHLPCLGVEIPLRFLLPICFLRFPFLCNAFARKGCVDIWLSFFVFVTSLGPVCMRRMLSILLLLFCVSVIINLRAVFSLTICFQKHLGDMCEASHIESIDFDSAPMIFVSINKGHNSRKRFR